MANVRTFSAIILLFCACSSASANYIQFDFNGTWVLDSPHGYLGAGEFHSPIGDEFSGSVEIPTEAVDIDSFLFRGVYELDPGDYAISLEIDGLPFDPRHPDSVVATILNDAGRRESSLPIADDFFSQEPDPCSSACVDALTLRFDYGDFIFELYGNIRSGTLPVDAFDDDEIPTVEQLDRLSAFEVNLYGLENFLSADGNFLFSIYFSPFGNGPDDRPATLNIDYFADSVRGVAVPLPPSLAFLLSGCGLLLFAPRINTGGIDRGHITYFPRKT